MTGYTVHTGSTEKFSTGWDQIFKANSTAKKSAVKQTDAGNAGAEPSPEGMQAKKKSAKAKSIPAKASPANSAVKVSAGSKTSVKKVTASAKSATKGAKKKA